MRRYRSNRQRGISLASSLLLAVVLLILLFTISGASITNYSISTRAENTRIALTLAESAANLAVSQCQTKLDWGVSGALDENIKVTANSAPGGLGRVVFDQVTANADHLPRSVNNLNSRDSVVGYAGRVVPGESLHVLATGSYQGITKTIETIINIPPYKFAIASTGPINSNGGLLLASVSDPAVVAGGADHIDPNKLKPAHILSNNGDNPALKLEGTKDSSTTVMGDAEAVGGIEIGKFAEVKGAVKSQQAAQPIPTITVTDFDPQGQSNAVTLGSNLEAGGLNVTGPSRRAGNLEVHGGLNLDGGYLYVDGDLDVFDGIKGRGAIFATGHVKVHGISSMVADDRQAIIAQGDVGVEGSSKNSSVYQGVIYTGGKFNAKHMTLLGALIANGNNSEVELQNVNMLFNPDAVNFQWDASWQPALSKYGLGTGFAHPGGVPTGALQIPHSNIAMPYDVALSTALLELDPSIGPGTFWVENPPKGPPGFYFDPKLVKSRIKVPTFAQTPVADGHTVTYTDINYETVPSLDALFVPDDKGNPQLTINTVNVDTGTFSDPRSLLNSLTMRLGIQKPNLEQAVRLAVEAYNERYQETKPGWVSKGEFTFDPNRFIATSDKMRRLLWREYSDPNQNLPK